MEVGITNFVNYDNVGFEGILKMRYTDFLVNEILPNGDVLHLKNLRVPREAEATPARSDGKINKTTRETSGGAEDADEVSKPEAPAPEVSQDSAVEAMEDATAKNSIEVSSAYTRELHC